MKRKIEKMKSKRMYKIVKQILDSMFGTMAFIMCIPIYIIISIILKTITGGKVFYKQERIRKKR